MYNVVLFIKNKPHDEENFLCGFYSEDLQACVDFLSTVDFDSCEALIIEENDNEMSN